MAESGQFSAVKYLNTWKIKIFPLKIEISKKSCKKISNLKKVMWSELMEFLDLLQSILIMLIYLARVIHIKKYLVQCFQNDHKSHNLSFSFQNLSFFPLFTLAPKAQKNIICIKWKQ